MILERIRFMKVNKHKKFHFTPRYYDERKERIEKIKEKYKEEPNTDISSLERQAQLRDKLQTTWYSDNSYRKQSRMANVRIIFILAALLLVAYYILGYVDIFTAEIIELD